MKKCEIERVEPPSERVDNIQRLVRVLQAESYELSLRATPEELEQLHVMQSLLDDACRLYRVYQLPWDSRLIDVPEKIGDIRFTVKAISTFDSVMDRARDLFVFLNLKSTAEDHFHDR